MPQSHQPERSRLPYTPERCNPAVTEPGTVYEHVHRYGFAALLVADRDVLDIGSGEGYGSAMLSLRARSVVGIDADSASVAHASRRYGKKNLEYREMSATDMAGIGDATIDVAVCFEMIEHVREHDLVMAGVKRVLRDDGILIISTPDRDIYTVAAAFDNPYHIRELSLSEFRALLDGYFRHVELFGQSFTVGSRMARLNVSDNRDCVDFVGQRADGVWTSVASTPYSYLVAVASDTPLPPLPAASHLHDSSREFAVVADELMRERDAIVNSRSYRILRLISRARSKIVSLLGIPRRQARGHK